MKGEEATMRIRKAWLTSAATVVAVLFAATAAMAHDSSSPTCTSGGLPVPIEVVDGTPCTVTAVDAALPNPVCKGQPGACTSECGPDYTGIQYEITGAVDYVATLVTADNTVVPSTCTSVYPPCKGDEKIGLGKYSCHEQAVKPKIVDNKFWIIVEGNKQAIQTSVAAKKYSKTLCSAILGLGVDAPVAPVTETLQHGECAVEFTMNSLTGTVLSAKLTPASVVAGCESPDMALDGTLDAKAVETLELVLNGETLGGGNYGNGFFNSGIGSCTTRVIGGRVYTWGKPCP